MKKCFKCFKLKPLDGFYAHRAMGDGYLNKCKDCTKLDVKNNTTNYDFTEKGVIRVMYKTQVSNSKKRNMPPPNYRKGLLRDWLYNNGFAKYYQKWVESGFAKKYKPSVDRIDDFKPYTLCNIQLGTWEDNFKHSVDDAINGIGTMGAKTKTTLQFKDGKLIASYVSYSGAARIVGYKFDHIINTGKTDKNGFMWYYKEYIDTLNLKLPF